MGHAALLRGRFWLLMWVRGRMKGVARARRGSGACSLLAARLRRGAKWSLRVSTQLSGPRGVRVTAQGIQLCQAIGALGVAACLGATVGLFGAFEVAALLKKQSQPVRSSRIAMGLIGACRLDAARELHAPISCPWPRYAWRLRGLRLSGGRSGRRGLQSKRSRVRDTGCRLTPAPVDELLDAQDTQHNVRKHGKELGDAIGGRQSPDEYSREEEDAHPAHASAVDRAAHVQKDRHQANGRETYEHPMQAHRRHRTTSVPSRQPRELVAVERGHPPRRRSRGRRAATPTSIAARRDVDCAATRHRPDARTAPARAGRASPTAMNRARHRSRCPASGTSISCSITFLM